MAFNVDSAHITDDDGLAYANDDGEITYYQVSDVGTPLGQQAPVPTVYTDRNNGDKWIKYGPGVNDWLRSPRTEANFPFTDVDLGVYKTERNFSARNFAVQTLTVAPQTLFISIPDAGADQVAYSLSSGELEFNQDISGYCHFQFGFLVTVADALIVMTLERSTGGGPFAFINGSLITQSVSLVGAFGLCAPTREIRIDALKGDIIRMRANIFAAGPTVQSLASGNVLKFTPITPTDNSENLFLNCGMVGDQDENDKHRCFDCGEV